MGTQIKRPWSPPQCEGICLLVGKRHTALCKESSSSSCKLFLTFQLQKVKGKPWAVHFQLTAQNIRNSLKTLQQHVRLSPVSDAWRWHLHKKKEKKMRGKKFLSGTENMANRLNKSGPALTMEQPDRCWHNTRQNKQRHSRFGSSHGLDER